MHKEVVGGDEEVRYLHGVLFDKLRPDLGSTVLETNFGGATVNGDQIYSAHNPRRHSGLMQIGHEFTGQP